MLPRAAAPLLLLISLALPGCVGGDRAPVPAQPIRVEDEPEQTEDSLGAVPDQEGEGEFGFDEAGEADVEEETSDEPPPEEDPADDAASGEESIGDEGGDIEIEIEEE
ncbi:MAG TPA: hypothetical protein VKZ63_14940 [Kofleriaceae bacterium]|nr:hypothetical protein [Kofleriaceae bacterium]